jgi:cell pole-organizing protein PopZ
MDEILSSIRRILNEDEQQEQQEETASADAEDEILVLSAEMEARPEEVSAPLESEAISPGAPRDETEMEQSMDEDGQNKAGLVSDMATAEITSALGSLVRGVSEERSVAVSRGGVTLEDIVREEIRPVLKAWLDANLPSLVERVVRAEIERVIDRTKR